MFKSEAQFKRISKIIFFSVLAFTVFLIFQFRYLKFDYDFEKFFPKNDEETAFFFEYREKFNSDNDFLLIAIENDPSIFEKSFLKKARSFSENLEDVKNIVSVDGITNQKQIFIYQGGMSSSRLYLDSSFNNLAKDSAIIYQNQELINSFVAKDAKSLCFFVKHTDYLAKKKSDVLITKIKSLASEYNFDKIRIAGRTIGQKYYVEKMTYEMILFVGLSILLIILFLFIAFRSIWGVLLPQVVIILSMVWIMGLMGLFNQPINLILVTLPSIMFVVSMSDVIHLVSRYLDALRNTGEKFEAINIALREVGMATFLTSLTTAVGFYSLYFVKVQPIQIFGLVTGTGVLVAFFLTISLLPVIIYWAPSPKYMLTKKEGNFWKKYLAKWFVNVLKKRYYWLAGTLVIALISTWGLLQMKSNNYLMDDLKDSESLKQDFNYLDKHYGGVRPFEVAILLNDQSKSIWDLEVLREIEKIEKYSEEVYGAKINISLVKAIKILNKAAHSGQSEYMVLPESQRAINKFKRPLRLANQGKLFSSLVDTSQTLLRINGSTGDLGNLKFFDKNAAFESFVKTEINPDLLTAKITGTAHLFDKNMRYLSVSLVQGLLFSVLIVALIMGFVYKSFKMTLLSMIPNILPLILIAGIMGFIGINLKVSTSIIFVIAFGIAVDDTIHFLGKFKLELSKGKSKIYALKRAYLTTGKAMILTTLILCAGFLLLVLSSFLGTFYMGLLLCVTLFSALVFDLTVLPILLFMFYHPKKIDNKV